MKKNGLTFTKGTASKIIKPLISSSPEILADAEIIFLFVKSYSTVDALENISNHINKNCIIVSLQNGLGNIEEISKYINQERIVYGTTTMGGS